MDSTSIEGDSASVVSSKSTLTSASTYHRGGASDRYRRHQQEQHIGVAEGENKAVGQLKFLVVAALLVAVCAVATAIYLLVIEGEEDDFEAAYTAHASEITKVARQKADQVFDAMNALSQVIASQVALNAAWTNRTWPFVTVYEWSQKAEAFASLVGEEGDKFDLMFAPVIDPGEELAWPGFAMQEARIWYQNSIDNENSNYTVGQLLNVTIPFVWDYFSRLEVAPVDNTTALPVWQRYPLSPDPFTGTLTMNYDLLDISFTKDLFVTSNTTLRPSIGLIPTRASTTSSDQDLVLECQIMQPIVVKDDTTGNEEMVGVAFLLVEWTQFFAKILGEGIDGFVVALETTCPRQVLIEEDALKAGLADKEFGYVSFEINGPNATFLGSFDAHDPRYDYLEFNKVLVDLDVDPSIVPEGSCVPTLTMHVYPSRTFEEKFKTHKAIIYTAVVISIFVFTSAVFLLYDYFVRRRQGLVMNRIMKQDLIVSNVFPMAIRERLYNQRNGEANNEDDMLDPLDFGSSSANGGGAPLADLFSNTTVVFADIAGFTAWSSAREPPQVFMLLESIYGAFDEIAYRHGIFKVETVGDCYVGVAGLPDPMDDHAVAACKFARACLKKIKTLVLKLEVSLGPDTADLGMRIGISSGQVTAGVLRGERSRFQLFGDTMNTAARMQSSCDLNRIQVSQSTADLVSSTAFSSWVVPRETTILVKGKGEIQTYWLKGRTNSKHMKKEMQSAELGTLKETDEATAVADSSGSWEIDDEVDDFEGLNKMQRLVEWNVDVLASLLQQIIASRAETTSRERVDFSLEDCHDPTTQTVLDEFVPIIPLKRFDAEELKNRRRPSSVEISKEVKGQLREYLTNISSMYKDNPFHNFEHASHVTASVKKLLKRIVNVDGNGLKQRESLDSSDASVDLVDLAGHSYGITSDPMTQFAVVFSAIIHDVDHPGVPNTQLVKENTRNALIYKKSVAEQNSIDLAWEMFMHDDFQALRACIYQTEAELQRFRQLVVNTVLATDIVDKELQALRKARWETAFSATLDLKDDVDSEDRKATIVIEHLIQASDVSHTMQHWHIYKKWNERFFMECYGAYKAGRADVDPSINWYKGEIGFFDFYVIPLAKKLENCGVFGVHSHEYMNYASANRDEWVREGEKIVAEFLAKYAESESTQME